MDAYTLRPAGSSLGPSGLPLMPEAVPAKYAAASRPAAFVPSVGTPDAFSGVTMKPRTPSSGPPSASPDPFSASGSGLLFKAPSGPGASSASAALNVSGVLSSSGIDDPMARSRMTRSGLRASGINNGSRVRLAASRSSAASRSPNPTAPATSFVGGASGVGGHPGLTASMIAATTAAVQGGADYFASTAPQASPALDEATLRQWAAASGLSLPPQHAASAAAPPPTAAPAPLSIDWRQVPTLGYLVPSRSAAPSVTAHSVAGSGHGEPQLQQQMYGAGTAQDGFASEADVRRTEAASRQAAVRAMRDQQRAMAREYAAAKKQQQLQQEQQQTLQRQAHQGHPRAPAPSASSSSAASAFSAGNNSKMVAPSQRLAYSSAAAVASPPRTESLPSAAFDAARSPAQARRLRPGGVLVALSPPPTGLASATAAYGSGPRKVAAPPARLVARATASTGSSARTGATQQRRAAAERQAGGAPTSLSTASGDSPGLVWGAASQQHHQPQQQQQASAQAAANASAAAAARSLMLRALRVLDVDAALAADQAEEDAARAELAAEQQAAGSNGGGAAGGREAALRYLAAVRARQEAASAQRAEAGEGEEQEEEGAVRE